MFGRGPTLCRTTKEKGTTILQNDHVCTQEYVCVRRPKIGSPSNPLDFAGNSTTLLRYFACSRHFEISTLLQIKQSVNPTHQFIRKRKKTPSFRNSRPLTVFIPDHKPAMFSLLYHLTLGCTGKSTHVCYPASTHILCVLDSCYVAVDLQKKGGLLSRSSCSKHVLLYAQKTSVFPDVYWLSEKEGRKSISSTTTQWYLPFSLCNIWFIHQFSREVQFCLMACNKTICRCLTIQMSHRPRTTPSQLFPNFFAPDAQKTGENDANGAQKPPRWNQCFGDFGCRLVAFKEETRYENLKKKKRKESFISFMKRAMQPSRIMKILGCNLKTSLHFNLFFGCSI